jgi:hypothetical protein
LKPVALPDPRRYGSDQVSHPLLTLVRNQDLGEVVAALRELARAGHDDEIARALSAAQSQPEYAGLWRALCTAVEKPAADAALSTRLFAMPWAIVCGGSAPATVSCVLPDVAAFAGVLEKHGVFGGSRNLGFANALCALETLEALAPSAVLGAADNQTLREVAPAPIAVLRGIEEVHVRFLFGAAIAPANAPDIVETGANIGAWGTAALRTMAAQLATPNVQILPMPRPPAGLYSAMYAGRRAGLEVALNLFMSNSVRQFRVKYGDPSIALSTHAGGEVRVTLWTLLDDAMVEGFRWPLHPADDLEEIERTIGALAAECRLPEPSVHLHVLPDVTSTGAVLFVTA